MAEDTCLIWSNEHRAWWRAGHNGHTRTLDQAGRYTLAQAVAICANAIPTARDIGHISEVPVRVADLAAVLLRYPTTIPDEIGNL